MKIIQSQRVYGLQSENRLAETATHDIDGARAALESFYYALNQRDSSALCDTWLDDSLVQLNNPLGGILRGRDGIVSLYRQVFASPAAIRVQFEDIVEYVHNDVVVFAGRERGHFQSDGDTIPIEIRTSRVFAYVDAAGGWRQIHHHGSVDDASILARYRKVATGQSQMA